MTWQMNPFPRGRNNIGLLQTIFVHVILDCAPQKFLQVVNFSAIENYINFTFLSDVYTHLQL